MNPNLFVRLIVLQVLFNFLWLQGSWVYAQTDSSGVKLLGGDFYGDCLGSTRVPFKFLNDSRTIATFGQSNPLDPRQSRGRVLPFYDTLTGQFFEHLPSGLEFLAISTDRGYLAAYRPVDEKLVFVRLSDFEVESAVALRVNGVLYNPEIAAFSGDASFLSMAVRVSSIYYLLTVDRVSGAVLGLHQLEYTQSEIPTIPVFMRSILVLPGSGHVVLGTGDFFGSHPSTTYSELTIRDPISGSVLWRSPRYRGVVSDLEYSVRYGYLIASFFSYSGTPAQGSVQVWRIHDGSLVYSLTASNNQYAAPDVLIHLDDATMFIAYGSTIQKRNIVDGSLVFEFTAARSGIGYLDISPDGRWLLSSSAPYGYIVSRQDYETRLWWMNGLHPPSTCHSGQVGITHVFTSASGRYLGLFGIESIIFGQVTNNCVVYDLSTMTRLGTVVFPPSFSWTKLALTNDGTTIMAYTGQSSGGLIRGYRVADGSQVINRTLSFRPASLEFSPDGTTVAIRAQNTNEVRIENVMDGTVISRFVEFEAILNPFTYYTSDGAHLIIFGGFVLFRGQPTEQIVVQLSDMQVKYTAPRRDGTGRVVNKVVLSPDGNRYALVLSNGTVELWNIQLNGLERVIGHPHPSLVQVRFTPDGEQLTICDSTGLLSQWDASTGASIGPLAVNPRFDLESFIPASSSTTIVFTRPANSSFLSPTMELVESPVQPGHQCLGGLYPHPVTLTVSFTGDGRQIMVDDIRRRFLGWDVRFPQHQVSVVHSYNPDASLVSFAVVPFTPLVCTVTTLENRVGLMDVVKGIIYPRFAPSSSPAVVSSDGQFVAYKHSSSNSIVVARVSDGQILYSSSQFSGELIGLSKDGRYFALYTGSRLNIIATAQNELLLSIPVDSVYPVRGVFSPDAQSFVLTNRGRMTLYRLVDGSVLWTKSQGYQIPLFTPDGKYILVTGDTDLRWISTPTGTVLQTIIADTPVHSITIRSDGKYFAWILGDRLIRLSRNPYWLEGDVDGSGCVDDTDLLHVLFSYGTDDAYADFDDDGTVDDADLLCLLFGYGLGCL